MPCADLLQRCVDMAGCKKVVAIVSDNASAAKLARELLVKEKGYKHILEFRCMVVAGCWSFQCQFTNNTFATCYFMYIGPFHVASLPPCQGPLPPTTPHPLSHTIIFPRPQV